MLPVTSALNTTAPNNPSLFREDLCIQITDYYKSTVPGWVQQMLVPTGKRFKTASQICSPRQLSNFTIFKSSFFLPLSPPTDINSQHRWWFVVIFFFFFTFFPTLSVTWTTGSSWTAQLLQKCILSVPVAPTHPWVVIGTLKWIMSHFCCCFHPQISSDSCKTRWWRSEQSLSSCNSLQVI